MMRQWLVIGAMTIAAFIPGCEKNPTSPQNHYVLPGLTMVSISGGTFQMGDTNSALNAAGADAMPVHTVTLGAFTISSTLITQSQFVALMDTNPSFSPNGGKWPIENVNWYDAVRFCNKLSKLAGKDTVYRYAGAYLTFGYDTLASVTIDYTKNGFRLPSEAEYEYAYRAGTTTDYYWGGSFPPMTTADTLAIDTNAVWFINSSSTLEVGSKKPNAWGLYDMAGNVAEWCNDWYEDYGPNAQTNPAGA